MCLPRARRLFERLTDDEAQALTRNIVAGLPGATSDSLDLTGMRDKLAAYVGVGPDALRAQSDRLSRTRQRRSPKGLASS